MTAMLKRYAPVLLAVAVVGGIALSQSFVGPVVQPRPTAEASFPAADSGYVTGAIAYGSTNRALYFSDGIEWHRLLHGGDAGAGGALYWYDAGAGLMYTDTAVALQPDGGSALRFSVASGTDAVSFLTTGARFDLGAGTNDYAASDGTGIETPSYWESTRTTTTGPGIISNGVTVATTSTQDFTSSLSTTYAAGSIATDDLQGTMIRRLSGGTDAFAPIAPHIVYDEQTFTTRIIGRELRAPPKFAELVPLQDSSVDKYLDMYWTTGFDLTVLLGTRVWYPVATAGTTNDQQYGISTASTLGTVDGTSFLSFVESTASPSMCQRVRTDSSITDMRVWVGLGFGTLNSATSTMSADGVFLRYDSSVDTDWQLCTRDGTTASCAKTSVTVTTSTEYVLCVKLDSSRNAHAYINGLFVLRKTTNKVPDGKLGVFVSAETLANAQKTLNIGVMQIGSR